jgi:hypothetical protein
VRPCCSFMGCRSPGLWTDDEDGRPYCGAHLIYVAYRDVCDDEAKQKRRDFSDEYARDAEREAVTR